MIGWLVDERGIEPHVKLMDRAERTDGTLSRSDTPGILPRPLSVQSEVTPIIAKNKRLGANEFPVSQLGKRIVKVAPGRGTEID